MSCGLISKSCPPAAGDPEGEGGRGVEIPVGPLESKKRWFLENGCFVGSRAGLESFFKRLYHYSSSDSVRSRSVGMVIPGG